MAAAAAAADRRKGTENPKMYATKWRPRNGSSTNNGGNGMAATPKMAASGGGTKMTAVQKFGRGGGAENSVW
ncbi:unnamed protein product [Lampetra planeri]